MDAGRRRAAVHTGPVEHALQTEYDVAGLHVAADLPAADDAGRIMRPDRVAADRGPVGRRPAITDVAADVAPGPGKWRIDRRRYRRDTGSARGDVRSLPGLHERSHRSHNQSDRKNLQHGTPFISKNGLHRIYQAAVGKKTELRRRCSEVRHVWRRNNRIRARRAEQHYHSTGASPFAELSGAEYRAAGR